MAAPEHVSATLITTINDFSMTFLFSLELQVALIIELLRDFTVENQVVDKHIWAR